MICGRFNPSEKMIQPKVVATTGSNVAIMLVLQLAAFAIQR